MKNKPKELDVDFIGGQGSITKEEELAISEFLKANKAKRKLQELPEAKIKTSLKSKQHA